MRWMKIAASSAIALGIGIAGAAPGVAADPVSGAAGTGAVLSAPLVSIEQNRELRAATPAEQRQLGIDSTRSLFPGITDADAEAYNSATERMSQLVLQLETEQRASFARAVQAPGEKFSVTVYFKKPTEAALATVKNAGIAGLSIDTSARYTQKEQQLITHKAFEAVAATGLTTALDAQYDWERNVVVVHVAPKEGVSLAQVTAGLPTKVALTGVLDALGGAVSTPVEFALGDTAEPSVLSGGTALSRGYSGTPNDGVTCTAAFGVVGNYGNASGKTGLLTAEHCETPLVYEARLYLNPVTIYDGSVRADARMFHNANERPRRDFISSQSSSGALITKPALATGSPYQGMKACTYGSTTGPKRSRGQENCDIVGATGADTSFCVPSGNCYQYYNQAVTANAIIERGDSGGPWFINNTALGISSAFNTSGNAYSKFQPISDATRKTGTGVIVN